jgi:hypothetical protein
MNPLVQLKQTTSLLLVALGLACFGLSTTAQAVSPAPDGGYSGRNTAEGDKALFKLTTGVDNTAVGFHALRNINNALGNTAIGSNALSENTTGFQNTAIGSGALGGNTTGYANTVTGDEAMGNPVQHNTGSSNTANGFGALYNNTTGFGNTAIGIAALTDNTTGQENTGVGDYALYSNTTGSANIAIGPSAGINLTTGSHNIDIGALGLAGESNKIRIGKQGTQDGTFISGIFGVAVTGSSVVVNAHGQLGVSTSSARYKQEIKSMDNRSEAILALKPVTFHYKKEIDPAGTSQFGLVAEEVEKVNPDLVVRDENGDLSSVRYEAVNAMLLNEFLKEHKRTEKLEATVASLAATVKEQSAQIQKVSAQLEASKTAPRVVNNP